jgi:carboxymethylenebutenolidase
VIDRVAEMTCPILALMGGDDPGIPQEAVDEYEKALEAAGVAHEVVVYPGAPHSFFDRKYQDFADESADAWGRVLEFIVSNS